MGNSSVKIPVSTLPVESLPLPSGGATGEKKTFLYRFRKSSKSSSKQKKDQAAAVKHPTLMQLANIPGASTSFMSLSEHSLLMEQQKEHYEQLLTSTEAQIGVYKRECLNLKAVQESQYDFFADQQKHLDEALQRVSNLEGQLEQARWDKNRMMAAEQQQQDMLVKRVQQLEQELEKVFWEKNDVEERVSDLESELMQGRVLRPKRHLESLELKRLMKEAGDELQGCWSLLTNQDSPSIARGSLLVHHSSFGLEFGQDLDEMMAHCSDKVEIVIKRAPQISHSIFTDHPQKPLRAVYSS